jgi:beta-lactamase class A
MDVSASIRVNGAPADATSLHPDADMAIASVGKLLLLIETARQIEVNVLDPRERLSRESVEAVADSGLWQHIEVVSLSIPDLATLIGSVSDNLATNVLLARVGLRAVDETRAALGLQTTRLLDLVRDERGTDDPACFARGSTAELCELMERLGEGTVVSAEVSRMVLGWLTTNVDQSMVGSGFGLDPLAHAPDSSELQLFNKTGSDATVRAEAGLLRSPQGRAAYAAIVNWPAAETPSPADVATAMRNVGASLRLALGA